MWPESWQAASSAARHMHFYHHIAYAVSVSIHFSCFYFLYLVRRANEELAVRGGPTRRSAGRWLESHFTDYWRSIILYFIYMHTVLSRVLLKLWNLCLLCFLTPADSVHRRAAHDRWGGRRRRWWRRFQHGCRQYSQAGACSGHLAMYGCHDSR